jgi:hypothetical protein
MRNAAWLLAIVAIAAIAALARAEPGTGTVVISCNEDEATLLVDGILIPERTPAVLTLPVGPHTIEARKPTLIPQKKTVDVTDQGQTKLRFELLPPASAPLPPLEMGSGSAVGSAVGSGSAGPAFGSGSAAPLPPMGSAVGSAAVGIGSNAPIETHPPPITPGGIATLDIVTATPHALVFVDGIPLREAPTLIEVESGEHVVAVYVTGKLPAEAVVRVRPGDRHRVELNPSVPRKRIDVPAE